ncbi:FHA domain-containing protein [Oceanobacillus sojae]|uniref:FHA domain-containing protein n=1 Tax=Oceanobacillus sojae TaxID=582851 RepID=UPI0021A6F2F8|nr:FHA domain-containing protein [Oceanobacillus sojae]MCT1901545.1 FHA domain-containing protein [Oceanobacillus sojae]
MSNPLELYHIDQLESNGGYMKLKQTNEKGFSEDDFQELQLKMIQSNRIPRLLPISLEEMNEEITVFYKTEGLRKLRPFAKERPLSMQNYYALFINIIQALQDSNNNMLSEDNFVLDEEYIYIGDAYHQVYLMYVPLKEGVTNSTLYESLKKLLLNMASEVKGLNGVQFKTILNYIKDPGFSLHGIKQLLSQLQKQGYQREEEEAEGQREVSQPKEIIKIKKVRKMPPLASKVKTYSILIGVLLLAGVWRLYMDAGNTTMLVVSIILSLVIIAGVYVYWFVWRPSVKPIITEKEVKVKAKPTKQAASRKIMKETNAEEQQTVGEISATAITNNQQVHNEGITEFEPITFSDDNKLGETNDQTTLLDETEMIPEKSKKIRNYLVINRDEAEEEIQLEKDNFIIGRAEKGTDFIEKAVGISRLHVELVKLSDTYGIKDLGAKNGTYINNEKIIPYKIYELSSNDTIQIGKTVYTYKVSE